MVSWRLALARRFGKAIDQHDRDRRLAMVTGAFGEIDDLRPESAEGA
jgi:hypothetical protein